MLKQSWTSSILREVNLFDIFNALTYDATNYTIYNLDIFETRLQALIQNNLHSHTNCTMNDTIDVATHIKC